MNSKEFVEKMNELRQKYNFCIQEDCDLWSLMSGFLFYENEHSEKPFAHITGVKYSKDGSDLEGDFDGVLKLLRESVDVVYNAGWIGVEQGLPKAGDYDVRVIRDGETLYMKKRLMISEDKHKWFGGMRPFCENDVVTHYKV
jgi:hypothetical protein